MKSPFGSFTCLVFALWVMGVNVNVIFAFSSGPPNGRTGSPADDFKTCKDIGCHNSFALNSGKAEFSISVPDYYTLGEVVPVTISFNNSNTAKHGFELSALDASDKHAGIFNSVDNKTQTDDGKGNYIKHTSAGSSQSGNASWNVTWTAPSSEVKNPVTFYATGNEANGDGTHNGDYIYKITRVISQLAPTPTPTPVGCETEAISASPNELELNRGESAEVVVTLIPAEGCQPEEGGVITAKVNRAGRKCVSVLPQSAKTNTRGEAVFAITAKKKTGNAKIRFRYGNLKITVKVKVVR
ncbi:MAG: hypothetical protein HRF42_00960 [Candidatus Brocadia sp.]|jgi:hypothetical protein